MPTATTQLLTIVFTDLVGSTALRQTLGDRASAELFARHHAVLRECLVEAGGEEIETAGDSLLITFSVPSAAVRFALEARRRMAELEHDVRDRVGIHLGEVVVRHDGTAGRKNLASSQLDLCARVMSLASDDRILMTRAVFDSARQQLKGDALVWTHHGSYALKGIEEPVEVCEVTDRDQPIPEAPTGDAKGKRVHGDIVAGWRPGAGQVVPGTSYVLEDKIGEGGVGEVWLAVEPQLGDARVFKFCFEADKLRSLRREVELFRLVRERVGNHPGIVALRGINFDEQPYFLVTDWVAGRDLERWWAARSTPPPLALRVRLVAQVAEALQAAHDAGVVHRDVKPQNILIDERPDGPFPMLADFGIGQALDHEMTDQAAGLRTIVASRGATSGTLAYLPPEILAGLPASPRSDVFSLGILLWQLALGDLQRPLPPDWAASVDDPLIAEDLERCLAGDPSQRPSALELARSLRALPERREAALREEEAQRARERRAWRRGVGSTVVGAALVLGVMGVLAWQALLQATRAEDARRAAEASEAFSREMAAELEVAAGMARLAEGDPARALAPFAAALERSVGDPAAERRARIRLRRSLELSPRPVFAPSDLGKISGAAVSWDGNQLALAVPGTGVILQDLASQQRTVVFPTVGPPPYLVWHRTEPWLGLWARDPGGGPGDVLVLDVAGAEVLVRSTREDSPGAIFDLHFDGDRFRVSTFSADLRDECRIELDARARTAGPLECGPPETRSDAPWEVSFQMTPLGTEVNALRVVDTAEGRPVPRFASQTTGGIAAQSAEGRALMHFRPEVARHEVLRLPDGAQLTAPFPQQHTCNASYTEDFAVMSMVCGPINFEVDARPMNEQHTYVQVWRGIPIRRPFVKAPPGGVFATSQAGDRGAIATLAGVHVMDLVTGREILQEPTAADRNVRPSPTLAQLCVASPFPAGIPGPPTHTWRLVEVATGSVLFQRDDVAAGPRCEWKHDGSEVAVPFRDGVTVLDASGEVRRTIPLERPLQIAWRPDGGAAVMLPDALLLLDPEGRETGRAALANADVVASADGEQLFTFGLPGARLWTAREGVPQGGPEVSIVGVVTAAFSADSKRLLTLNQDGAVDLVDVETGRAVRSPFQAPAYAALPSVGFSPDGQLAHVWYIEPGTVASGGNLLTLDVSTGEPLGLERGPWVVAPPRRADGTWQVAGYTDAGARPVDDWVAIAALISGQRHSDGRTLTGEEVSAQWARLAKAYPEDFR